MIVACQQFCFTKSLKTPRKSQRVTDSPRSEVAAQHTDAPRIPFPALFRQFNAHLCSTPSRGRGENFSIADEFEAFRALNDNRSRPPETDFLDTAAECFRADLIEG